MHKPFWKHSIHQPDRPVRSFFTGWALACLAAGFIFFLPAIARCQEKILNFQSQVVLGTDGVLSVTETITAVTAEDAVGIYRYFPPLEAEQFFVLDDTAIDGKPQDGLTERLEDDRVRAIIQTQDGSIVPAGRHVYTLTYRIDPRVRLLQDRDELAWNATYSQWDCPIEKASVSVRFPEGMLPGKIAFDVRTGPPGSRASNIDASFDAQGALQLTLTRPLGPREGIEITAKLPKGFIRKGIASQKAERILDYQSRITVSPDGGMNVIETITVLSSQQEIKHGIYRDFPTDYEEQYAAWLPALPRRVAFDVVQTTRDGKPEPFRTEGLYNGMRVYIGSKDSLIASGEHTYTIEYTTDRQIGFFADHDELYWNVTGNGWAFPIEKAAATIELPAGVPRAAITTNGYTGPAGSTDQNLKAWVEPDSKVRFEALGQLDEKEGLTVVATFPKGFVAQPTFALRLRYLLRDALFTVLAGLLAVLVLLYYCGAWLLVGRDPDRGIIMPLYYPPKELSPAAVRYIARMGYDDTTLAAAVINMAVKGFVKIVQAKGVYTLTKVTQKKPAEPLAPEEDEAYNRLGDSLKLEQENHSRVASLISGLRETLERRFKKYFNTNIVYARPAIAASILALILTAIADSDRLPIMAFMVFFCFLAAFLYPLAITVKNAGQAGKTVLLVFAAAMLLGLVGALAALVFAMTDMARDTGFPVIFCAALVLLGGINFLFFQLLKAYTPAGRKLMDEIEGFRLYLAAAEQDRLDRLNPPEKTPELFEKYLPYALALGLEQRWAEQFAEVFPAAEAGKQGSQLSWYSDSDFRNLSSMSRMQFASSFGSSLAIAVSSSSTAPGSSSGSSSSGGGGGSSGGGGGGGGGGGW